MKNILYPLRNKILTGLALLGLLVSMGIIHDVPVSAAFVDPNALTVTLDVGNEGAFIQGELQLDWYVEGGPATCMIDQNEPFEVTTNPQSGSSIVAVPNVGDTITMTCSRGNENASDSVVYIPGPVVTLTEQSGSTEFVADASGIVQLLLSWNTDYGDSCSGITYTYTNDPETVYVVNSGQDTFQPEGAAVTSITESATFFITCSNNSTGSQTTETLAVTVLNQQPPADVEIEVLTPQTNPASVVRDSVTRFGAVRFEFDAHNADYCTDYRAFNVVPSIDANGDGLLDEIDYINEYPNAEVTPPAGYQNEAQITSRAIDLELGTSTVLTVRCGRSEVVINEITYPATSTTLVQTFILSPLPLSDARPYATATISVNSQIVERDLITGLAYVNPTVNANNIDYCNYTAYRVSDNSEYILNSWTRDQEWEAVWSDGNQTIAETYSVSLATSTRLEARCVNRYDLLHGSPEDIANAVYVASTTITVTEPTEQVATPKVWLYSGPSFQVTADDIWDLQTDNNNMAIEQYGRGLNRGHLRVDTSWNQNGTLDDSVGEISFTFRHPYGAGQSDIYNIHMRHCDESDGSSAYTFSTAGSGQIGTYVSDKSYPNQHILCHSATEEVVVVAEGVVLTDGEEITIRCTSDQEDPNVMRAEDCSFSDLYFGTGSGDEVISMQADIDQPVNDLIWMSEGVDSCEVKLAMPDTGSPNVVVAYQWSDSNRPYGMSSDIPRTNSTRYTISCSRVLDGAVASEEVVVYLSDTPLVTDEDVSNAETYSTGSCWDVQTDSQVYLPNAPENYVVAPSGLDLVPGTFLSREEQCVPLVDLSISPVYRGTNLATDSVINIADGVDNVNGTYDLSVVPYVQNFAAVELPANAAIPYRVTLTGSNNLLEVRDGVFNESLPANTPPNTYELVDERYSDVPFGTYNVEVRFNTDGAPNYPDSNFVNNQFVDTVTLAVPEPHMTLVVDDGRAVVNNANQSLNPPLVRTGYTTELTWSVNVNYPLNCTLNGKSIGTQNLTLDTVGSNQFGTNPSTNSLPISVTNTSEFELTCTEPNTGAAFSHTGLIEVVPALQEG